MNRTSPTHTSTSTYEQDITALDAVIESAREEHARLEKEEEEIMSTVGPDSPLLMDIYDRLDALDPNTFEKRAGELLFGLGFSHEMMSKKTKDLSGT